MTTSAMIFAIASSQCGEIVMTAIAIGNATIGLATATSTARSAASTAPGWAGLALTGAFAGVVGAEHARPGFGTCVARAPSLKILYQHQLAASGETATTKPSRCLSRAL